VIGTPYTHCLGPDLFHNLRSTFLVANAMHPSGNGLSPLLGIYRSTEVLCGEPFIYSVCLLRYVIMYLTLSLLWSILHALSQICRVTRIISDSALTHLHVMSTSFIYFWCYVMPYHDTWFAFVTAICRRSFALMYSFKNQWINEQWTDCGLTLWYRLSGVTLNTASVGLTGYIGRITSDLQYNYKPVYLSP